MIANNPYVFGEMRGCYVPPSLNLLENAPRFDSSRITPETIFAHLAEVASDRVARMQNLSEPFTDVLRVVGIFVIARRYVHVGLVFLAPSGILAAAPDAARLESIARQLNQVWN